MKDGNDELYHIYSTMHGKSAEEKDHLKRYINVDDIQSRKRKIIT